MHQALEISLARALNALDEGGAMSATALPSGPRVALKNRRDVLRGALAPSTPQAAARTLATLSEMAFRGEPTREMMAAIAKQNVADLVDLPAWALDAACRAYRLAEVGDGHWRPTAGMLRAEAVRRMEPLVRELALIGRALDAPVALAAPAAASPEQRERMNALWHDLKARMVVGGAEP
jgi:hypothetical protein